MDATIFGLQIFMLIGFVVGSHYSYGEYCYLYSKYSSYTYYTYCDNGCCYYECCDKTYHDLEPAAIIGIVIGSLIAATILISFIVCCICVCCKKNRGNAGMVVHPSPVSTVATPYPNVNYMRTDYRLPSLGGQHVYGYTSSTSVLPPIHHSTHVPPPSDYRVSAPPYDEQAPPSYHDALRY